MAKLFITLMLLIGMAVAESLPGEPTTSASDLNINCKQYLALPDRLLAVKSFDPAMILKNPMPIMNGVPCFYFVRGMMEETQGSVVTDRAHKRLVQIAWKDGGDPDWLIRDFVKYLSDNPDDLSKPAIDVLQITAGESNLIDISPVISNTLPSLKFSLDAGRLCDFCLYLDTLTDKNDKDPWHLINNVACINFTRGMMEEAEGSFMPDLIHVKAWKQGISAAKLIDTFSSYILTHMDDLKAPAVEVLEDTGKMYNLFDVVEPVAPPRPKRFLQSTDPPAQIREQ